MSYSNNYLKNFLFWLHLPLVYYLYEKVIIINLHEANHIITIFKMLPVINFKQNCFENKMFNFTNNQQKLYQNCSDFTFFPANLFDFSKQLDIYIQLTAKQHLTEYTKVTVSQIDYYQTSKCFHISIIHRTISHNSSFLR